MNEQFRLHGAFSRCELITTDTVDDVDATARTAEQLGATLLVPPRDIPDSTDQAPSGSNAV